MNLQFSNYVNKWHLITCSMAGQNRSYEKSMQKSLGGKRRKNVYAELRVWGQFLTRFPKYPEAQRDFIICPKSVTKY